MLKKLLLLSIISPQIVYAESLKSNQVFVTEDPSVAQEITSTSSKEIYTTQDIEQSGSFSIFDFLSQHTSINIQPQYGNKASPLIDMRGYGMEAGYQNIIINVDGERLNRIDTVPQIIGNIPLKSIERIEILRGSGSVRFGDGAMAGVINIITKNTVEQSFQSVIGTQGTQSNILNTGYQGDSFNIMLNTSSEKNDGQVVSDPSGDKAKSKNNYNKLTLNLALTNDLKVKMSILNSRSNNYFPNNLTKTQLLADPSQNGTGNEYTNNDYDTDSYSLKTSYQFNPNLGINMSYFKEDMSLYSQAYYANSLQDYDTESFNISLPYHGEKYAFTTGIQVTDGQRKDGVGDVTKKNKAIFVEAEIQLTDVILISGGLRHEKVDYTYDGTSSLKTEEALNAYEAGINYQINNQFSIFTNISHAYLAPDVDRFFIGVGYPIVDRTFNAFIDPAKSNTINLGFNYKEQHHSTLFTTYYTDLEDEIVYNPNSYINENIDNSEKYGLEIQHTHKVGNKTVLGINYNFVKANIGSNAQSFTDGNAMPGVPRQTLIANVNYQFIGNGFITLSHAWRERSYDMGDFANARDKEQPLYSSTDVSITYNLKNVSKFEEVAIFGSINNIFEHTNAIATNGNSFYVSNFQRSFLAGIKVNF
ncbi:TonB-dependent receptor [Methylophilaceae bacterium]|nr:TonB-dependent receptor [Methylophilaceae bacterium]